MKPSPVEAYNNYCDLLERARSSSLWHSLCYKIGFHAAQARLTGVSTEDGEAIFATEDEPLDREWLRAEAEHLRRFRSQPYRCGYCGMEYPDYYAMVRHESRDHGYIKETFRQEHQSEAN